MARDRSTIIAVTTDDDRYPHVRRRAVERARQTGATVVLFDVDAGKSLVASPLPTDWSGHGEAEQFGDRLTPSDLEAAGRRPIADQVRDARQAGVEAFGWLPDAADAEALRDYASRQGAGLVLVPAGDDRFESDIGAPVEVVDGAGVDRSGA